jgi:hypothetical protein
MFGDVDVGAELDFRFGSVAPPVSCLEISGEAVPGVALTGDSSCCWVGSSSSGICKLSFGRWPVEWFDIEPGVVVVIGGGELERGTLEGRICWL